jgi:cytochrome P450
MAMPLPLPASLLPAWFASAPHGPQALLSWLQALGSWALALGQGLLAAMQRNGPPPLPVWLLWFGVLVLAMQLPGLIPRTGQQLARLRELASRLWRLLLALVRELLWVDPTLRRARHQRWRPVDEEDSPLGRSLRQVLLDLIALPLDWVASLGPQRLLRPDPATEEKEQRRLRSSAALLPRLRWAWERHVTLYLGLSVLRLVQPRLWLPGALWRRFVHADSYPGFPIRGMLWLTRNADVRDVLERPETFEVIYGPRMQEVSQPLDPPGGGEVPGDPSEEGNFLLGMQDTPRYWRDISNMRLAFRREDAALCRQLSERAAESTLQRLISSQGQSGPLRLDLPVQLVVPALEALVGAYFGIPLPLRCGGRSGSDPAPGSDPGEDEVDVQHLWLEDVFDYLFYDLKGESSRPRALHAAPRVRTALQRLIRSRRQAMENDPAAREADDVLSRCLRLQRSGTPGMDDETLRVNLTGFLVGAMTPLINATCQVMDVLLERPRALALAQAAARDPDPDQTHVRLRACVMEALRFSPGDPVIYRWTCRDSWVGEGSRRRAIPRGTLVMAWNASAMFDPALVSAPWAFRTDRPAGAYLHWGHGQHSCAGAYINMAVIPAILAPLLRRGRLRRAEGSAGRMHKPGITVRHFELLLLPIGRERTQP